MTPRDRSVLVLHQWTQLSEFAAIALTVDAIAFHQAADIARD